jgi:hypothetical protein
MKPRNMFPTRLVTIFTCKQLLVSGTCLRYLTPLRRWSWPRMRIARARSSIEPCVEDSCSRREAEQSMGRLSCASSSLEDSRVPRNVLLPKVKKVATRCPMNFLLLQYGKRLFPSERLGKRLRNEPRAWFFSHSTLCYIRRLQPPAPPLRTQPE